jgi:hypothetical protein
MARSAHAYVRGSTAKFYEWLEESSGKVPTGPPIWICGDCHVGNLGPLADPKGRVATQIRDLDQIVIGSPAHDVIWLGLSLASAARGLNFIHASPCDFRSCSWHGADLRPVHSRTRGGPPRRAQSSRGAGRRARRKRPRRGPQSKQLTRPDGRAF